MEIYFSGFLSFHDCKKYGFWVRVTLVNSVVVTVPVIDRRQLFFIVFIVVCVFENRKWMTLCFAIVCHGTTGQIKPVVTSSVFLFKCHIPVLIEMLESWIWTAANSFTLLSPFKMQLRATVFLEPTKDCLVKYNVSTNLFNVRKINHPSPNRHKKFRKMQHRNLKLFFWEN